MYFVIGSFGRSGLIDLLGDVNDSIALEKNLIKNVSLSNIY